MQRVSLPEPQGARNLLPHLGGGTPGERDCLWPSQPIPHPGKLSEAGTKVVPPLRDAMRLVDDQQPGANATTLELEAQPVETLGRQIEEAE